MHPGGNVLDIFLLIGGEEEKVVEKMLNILMSGL